MNARQKAKRYKKQYYELLKKYNRWMQHYAFERQTYDIECLYTRTYVKENDPITEEEVREELIKLMLNGHDFKKYVNIVSGPADVNYFPGCIEYLAELKVVLPNDNPSDR